MLILRHWWICNPETFDNHLFMHNGTCQSILRDIYRRESTEVLTCHCISVCKWQNIVPTCPSVLTASIEWISADGKQIRKVETEGVYFRAWTMQMLFASRLSRYMLVNSASNRKHNPKLSMAHVYFILFWVQYCRNCSSSD